MDKPSILVIDDEEVMLDSCKAILDNHQFQLKTARDGNSGLELLQKLNPDIVLLDLKMPGKNGIEVLCEIKKINPECLVVIITGHGTVESAVEAMKYGAYDFLSKPFTPDDLRFIVKRGVDQRRCIKKTNRLIHEKQIIKDRFLSMMKDEIQLPLSHVEEDLLFLIEKIVDENSDDARHLLARMYICVSGIIALINDWLNGKYPEMPDQAEIRVSLSNQSHKN